MKLRNDNGNQAGNFQGVEWHIEIVKCSDGTRVGFKVWVSGILYELAENCANTREYHRIQINSFSFMKDIQREVRYLTCIVTEKFVRVPKTCEANEEVVTRFWMDSPVVPVFREHSPGFRVKLKSI